MTAERADVIYNRGDKVSIIFTDFKEKQTVTFKYRKTWSHKKYVDEALKQNENIKRSWNFQYGWDLTERCAEIAEERQARKERAGE